jgi:hypothetical protein
VDIETRRLFINGTGTVPVAQRVGVDDWILALGIVACSREKGYYR